jgi:predicted AAA+ superfamily ATPase
MLKLRQKYLSKIETSIAENPITILIGARQVGKTSLMESFKKKLF